MRNQKTRYIVHTAMYVSIMAVLAFGLAAIYRLMPVVSFTLLFVPVFVGAYFEGWKQGAILGFVWGILSLIIAATMPLNVVDGFFVNPLISVLPRVIFGLVAGITMERISKIKNGRIQSAIIPVSAAVLTLFHSVVTLLALGLIEGPAVSAENGNVGYWVLMGIVIGSNGVLEMILAGIIVPLVIFALLKAKKQN